MNLSVEYYLKSPIILKGIHVYIYQNGAWIKKCLRNSLLRGRDSNSLTSRRSHSRLYGGWLDLSSSLWGEWRVGHKMVSHIRGCRGGTTQVLSAYCVSGTLCALSPKRPHFILLASRQGAASLAICHRCTCQKTSILATRLDSLSRCSQVYRMANSPSCLRQSSERIDEMVLAKLSMIKTLLSVLKPY